LKEGEGVALNFDNSGIKLGLVLSQERFQIRSIDESRTLGLRKSEKEKEDRLDFPIEREPVDEPLCEILESQKDTKDRPIHRPSF